MEADPSGWLSTYSDADGFLSLPRLNPNDFARYYIDEGSGFEAEKEPVVRLISAWEGREISNDELTLCPSGASASLITLATLKALGVSQLLIETPCYFATLEQAEQIHLPFTLVPTYFADGYSLPSLERRIRRSSSWAIWLTQPRASLGFDQPLATIQHLLRVLGPKAYVVIDEVTDQSFPAHLRLLNSETDLAQVIRIRSFTKPMGLNGFRLAALLHPASLRKAVVNSLETFGGALDAHSLKTVAYLVDDLPRFRAMLRAANDQVINLRLRAERLVRNSPLFVNPLTNGYIGTLVADLTALGSRHRERRTRFLEGCRRLKTPVILGASSYMAKDPPREGVRLNFFLQPENITIGIHNMLRIWGD